VRARAVRVAGSLWSVPDEAREGQLRRAAAAGLSTVHWDHTDGSFAAPGGFDVRRAEDLMDSVPGLRAEAHLMVQRPADVVDAWTELCGRIVVHAEASGYREAIRRIERRGQEPALAISPGTDVRPFVSEELPLLIMSVVPGEAGSTFRTGTYDRVAQARSGSAPSRSIGVDGGVDATVAREVICCGADWLVSGTALFGEPDLPGWLHAITGPDVGRAVRAGRRG
jgi:ribulose-phosphate 3-epimerase